MTFRTTRLAVALTIVGGLLLSVQATRADAPQGHFSMGSGANAGTVYDTKTHLTWQQTSPAAIFTWSDAKKTCATLGLAGGGWRLPTLVELLSLVDFQAPPNASLDPTAFPADEGGWTYWTASATPAGASTSGTLKAWYLQGPLPLSVDPLSSYPYAIRCVR